MINSRLSNIEPISGSEGAHLATCENGEIVKGDIMLIATRREPVVTRMGLSKKMNKNH